MVRKLLAGGLGRAIVILGIVFFALYAIVALILGRTGFKYSEGLAAGIMAYLFIMAVLVLWLLERRRHTQPGAVAEEFLMNSRAVHDMIGAPVRVNVPSPLPAGKGPGQVTVDCFVTGPDGSGEAMVVLARLDRGYQVLGADLDIAGVKKSVAA
jgi:preprotein translocase subunit SecG